MTPIPHYPLSRPRRWLAWRLRVWSHRLDPARPRLLGPFIETDRETGCVSGVAWELTRYDEVTGLRITIGTVVEPRLTRPPIGG